MDKWEVRPGIALVEIAGVHLLAADREARKSCPYIMPVNGIGAAIWEELERGRCPAEIAARLRETYEIPEAYEVVKDVEAFLGELAGRKYVTRMERQAPGGAPRREESEGDEIQNSAGRGRDVRV